MKREILFRGKRLDNGKWEYGNYNNINGRAYLFPEDTPDSYDNYQVDPDTVGQYTGLLDKNGNRIFEGDIVRTEFSTSIIRFGEYQHVNAQNGYRNGDVGFFVEHIEESQRMYIRNDILYFNEQCEVVGNIHDNPDLLKGGKQ